MALPASVAYIFDIDMHDGWGPITASSGGPGLGWTFALNDAVRQHCKRRGDVGWRQVRGTVVGKLPLDVEKSPRWRALAHVQVQTTRHVDPMPTSNGRGKKGVPDLLDVWVRRARRSDQLEEVADEAASA